MPVETGDETEEQTGLLKMKTETEAARARRIVNSWMATLRTPEGRAVLWSIILRMGYKASPVSTDARVEQRNLGKHEAALELLADIEARAPALARMMKQENDN